MRVKKTPGRLIGLIHDFNAGRDPGLVAEKYRRMSEDVFAFYRGTDHLFARAWPKLKPADPGPEILISGDLHLENFGAYRDDDRNYVFDVNDFDEAVVAPCGLDLVRCTTSILLAAQVWKLRPIHAIRSTLGFLEHYRSTLKQVARSGSIGYLSLESSHGPVRGILSRTAIATESALLDRYTKAGKDGSRRFRRKGGLNPRVPEDIDGRIRAAFEEYGDRTGQGDLYKVLDTARRVAGIGGLGLPRYVAVVAGDGTPDGARMIDIKSVGPPSLASLGGTRQLAADGDEARRVVMAQRILQGRPTAHLDVLHCDGRSYRIREMIPDENRSSLDRLQGHPGKLRRAIGVAGRLAAWSQARGARWDGVDRIPELVAWAAGPSLDGVLAAAVRFAERARRDYRRFKAARHHDLLGPVSVNGSG